MSWVEWTIIAVYLLIGVWSCLWIRHDAEFRTGTYVPLSILALVAWPIANLIWMLIRGEEHLTEIAAKQSHRDYQVYMRTKTGKDLFANFPDSTKREEVEDENEPGPKPETSRDEQVIAAKQQAPLRDANVENLISERKWQEAEASARSMKRVAIQMEDNQKAYQYDEYLKVIDEGRSEDSASEV